ncbi:MAG: hypothetical protein U9R43_12060 [Thermodesulfobacteriota bacterium]|nr:hypothetical protein [Thermodesulfobacteriota bacterium]
MEKRSVTINRKELYEQVWSEPVSRLAPKYGISDVGLKKICRKLNVPTPPLGYWTKIQYNIRVEKTPLPRLKHGKPYIHTIHKSDLKGEDDFEFSAEAKEIISKFGSIKVPERLNTPHPLVRKTRDALSKAKPDKYGVLQNWHKKHLNVRVSAGLLIRALRIMNCLIKLFEKQGFEVSIGNEHESTGTYIMVFEEKIEFYIQEKSRRQDHVLTEKDKEELKRWSHAFIEKYDYISSGKLTLQIDSWSASGVRKRWSDGKIQRIENFLYEFAINVVKVADLNRSDRIEREERRRLQEEECRRQAEMERLRQIEEERLRDLENQADRWFRSNQLREYIRAVENAASERGFSINDDSLKSWLKWAKNHANRFDPLYNSLPFEDRT